MLFQDSLPILFILANLVESLLICVERKMDSKNELHAIVQQILSRKCSNLTIDINPSDILSIHDAEQLIEVARYNNCTEFLRLKNLFRFSTSWGRKCLLQDCSTKEF